MSMMHEETYGALSAGKRKGLVQRILFVIVDIIMLWKLNGTNPWNFPSPEG